MTPQQIKVDNPAPGLPPLPEGWVGPVNGPLEHPAKDYSGDVAWFSFSGNLWDHTGWNGDGYGLYILRAGSEVARKNGFGEPEEPKPKTIRELLTELPDGYRELAMEALATAQVGVGDAPTASLNDALFNSFAWRSTPQGYKWWKKVFEHTRDNTPLPPLPEPEKPKVEKWYVTDNRHDVDTVWETEDAAVKRAKYKAEKDPGDMFYVAKVVKAFRATTTVEEVEI